MDEATFEKFVDQVTDAMIDWVRPAITPLSSSSADQVRLEGTGTHIIVDGRAYILTCRHVSREKADHFSFYDTDNVYERDNAWIEAPGSLDSAVMPILDDLWKAQQNNARPVLYDEFAEKFDPVAREVLYFEGFGRENAKFVYETHFTNSLGYSTQLNEGFDSDDRFFYLHWDPARMKTTTRTSPQAAKNVKHDDADGYSGSLVWDTGFVRAWHEKRDWDPSMARVCGQLVTWDQKKLQVTARRIEDISSWINETLRPKQQPVLSS
ncbi:serine protease (plasmid) [Rhizobium leguminosarum]|uniref:hypothetical protein n=1 Tax=Rhizobium TaxID=379 RepID=UPI00102FF96B|nr:hypothetical protein [Rhizobium leguminosarum]TBH46093.1 hypothetical protein ELG62_36235 [Rhizobium leguminosarum]UIK01712.1 serine protease [Rhizobium leguminosarum]UIK14601.1 serine protease [Rhizobium leguminosarum]UIL31517.1 serine protease [Rhizobium leguminosarum]